MDCLVCLEPYDQGLHIPKFLIKCGHTICNSCLLNCLSQTSNRFINCPSCKCFYGLLEIRALPTNFAILNAIIQSQPSDQGNHSNHSKLMTLPCTIHKTMSFQYFCMDCTEPMCSKCLLEHNRSGHKITILDDEYGKFKDKTDTELMTIKRSIQFVKEGKQKYLSLLGDHQRLTKQKVEDTEAQFRSWMIMMKERKDSIIQSYYDASQGLDMRFKKYLQSLSGLEEQLKARLEELSKPFGDSIDSKKSFG